METEEDFQMPKDTNDICINISVLLSLTTLFCFYYRCFNVALLYCYTLIHQKQFAFLYTDFSWYFWSSTYLKKTKHNTQVWESLDSSVSTINQIHTEMFRVIGWQMTSINNTDWHWWVAGRSKVQSTVLVRMEKKNDCFNRIPYMLDAGEHLEA